MIAHLETVVYHLLELVGGWLCALLMASVLALACMAFLGLQLFKFDRDSCHACLRKLTRAAHNSWGWALTCVALLLMVYATKELHQGLQQRLAQQGKALYTSTEDSGGLPTVQRAPRVSVMETRTYTRTLVIPKSVTEIDTLSGWSPEEARYDARPAVRVNDNISKETASGNTLLQRTTEVDRFVPIQLAGSQVVLDLKFQRASAVYQADFKADYTVKNPFSEARRIHFNFPLPDNSGTLAGFRFRVDGREQAVQEVEKGLHWEGQLAAGASAKIEVAYGQRGSRSWSYDLTGRREPIRDFSLKVRSDKSDLKFERGSLFPSARSGKSWEWNLRDQITSQSISLFFPETPSEQVALNLFVFAPLALLTLTLLVVVWARLRHTGTDAWRTALAVLSSCGAYTLASYLMGYMPLLPALLIAFGATAWMQWRTLGNRLTVPVVSLSVAPFAFLASGHTGLLLSLLGLAVLWLTIRETLQH